MSTAPWSLHLLGEVLSAFSVERPTALRDVVTRVAEAVDAEITAIVRQGAFSLCTGLIAEEQGHLLALVPVRRDLLELGGRAYHLFWAPLGPEDLLVVGRAHEPYSLEERALLRGMGRSIQLSTQVLDALQAEKQALRAEKQAKEAAIREATVDHLTGLPNRRMLLRHLHQLLGSGMPVSGRLAVLFIDLDRFKPINDLHGHKAGDRVLQLVAAELRGQSRACDVVGRISGDEFLMISQLAEAGEAEQIATRVLGVLLRACRSPEVPFPLIASIGIALAEPEDTPDTLIENADLAMYAAKQQGRGRFASYRRSLRDRLEQRHRLQEELRRALADDQLRAWFQPVISSAHGAVVGFEALVRWQHPERGLLPPDDFLDVAEDCGLLRAIDTVILRDACRQISGWASSRDGLIPRLSVNVSAASLADPRLKDDVLHVLQESGFPAGKLFLEITETTLVEDVASASANISAIERMGIRLAIDDFGTGYSSLSYLKRFPVGILKIDRSFIQGLGNDSEDDVIVETVITMARSLGLEVVAEGVENDRQAQWLRFHGCHYLQGHQNGAAADGAASEALYRRSLEEHLGPFLSADS
ncbi:bifunctional diguanylate cyclase/phosphodiesterase [Cyanobium sp. FGCU-52]|nr:bifunctional diguanylate cyclase/phosphodiesterase [Cyanobium sp. FGCU52]